MKEQEVAQAHMRNLQEKEDRANARNEARQQIEAINTSEAQRLKEERF